MSPPLDTARLFAEPAVDVDVRSDGSRIFRNCEPLGPYANAIGSALARAATDVPDRTFIAERTHDGASARWRALTYGDTRERARALAQGLLDCGASPDRPIVIAAENGIAHVVVTLAAHEIGVPTIPLAPTRFREASSHATVLAAIVRDMHPSVAFVDDDAVGDRLRDAMPGLAIVRELATLSCEPRGSLDAHARRVGRDTVAKIVLTSGTTGRPKGVLTTHGMILSNQAAIAGVWPGFADEPPILVDWLPWSHSFGGTKLVHFVLHHAGTLYVDDGLPTQHAFHRTLANLRDVSPTAYFNVPRGYAFLVPALEDDAALRARFFARLRLAFSAGAMLPASLAERFARVRALATTRRVPLVGGWGLTETAPSATAVLAWDADASAIGVPLPGVEIKLSPVDDRYELRVRGPNVMPGYFGDAASTQAAFDADGFFRSGDAATLVDDARPERGFLFDGRLAENFKLSSGVWVRATILRDALLEATAPLVADVALAGDDADEVCALLFLETDVVADAAVRARIASGLAIVAARATGRNDRIARALVAPGAPSASAGEVTAKGTLNRRAALAARAAAVARLYAPDAHADPEMIVPAGTAQTTRI
ncbi:MAG: feruloyl-CoA synthase [Vulcanimicrobiaceae bacterium]